MMLDEGFVEFILEQLNGIPELSARRMFGEAGLYNGCTFFGIIAGETLYFKTNPETRARYRDYQMEPFRFSEKQISKNYFQVPEEILDDRFELLDWAEESIRVATDPDSSS